MSTSPHAPVDDTGAIFVQFTGNAAAGYPLAALAVAARSLWETLTIAYAGIGGISIPFRGKMVGFLPEFRGIRRVSAEYGGIWRDTTEYDDFFMEGV